MCVIKVSRHRLGGGVRKTSSLIKMVVESQCSCREGPILSLFVPDGPKGERPVKVQRISMPVPYVRYLNEGKREFPVPNERYSLSRRAILKCLHRTAAG